MGIEKLCLPAALLSGGTVYGLYHRPPRQCFYSQATSGPLCSAMCGFYFIFVTTLLHPCVSVCVFVCSFCNSWSIWTVSLMNKQHDSYFTKKNLSLSALCLSLTQTLNHSFNGTLGREIKILIHSFLRTEMMSSINTLVPSPAPDYDLRMNDEVKKMMLTAAGNK